jgi:hypothetical protein
MFPVRYEVGFYISEDCIFIVPAVKTSDLHVAGRLDLIG